MKDLEKYIVRADLEKLKEIVADLNQRGYTLRVAPFPKGKETTDNIEFEIIPLKN